MLTIFGFDEATQKCPHCINAKKLAEAKGVKYVFVSVAELINGEREFIKSNIDDLLDRLDRTTPVGLTMPQIFDGDTYVGGFSDLRVYLSGKK